MTMFILQNGNGNGEMAEVTGRNALKTESQASPIFNKMAFDGLGWTVSSGLVDLTSGNRSEILYIKNDSETNGIFVRDLQIVATESQELSGTPNPIKILLMDILVPAVTNAATALTPKPMRSSKTESLGATINLGGEGVIVSPAVTVAQSLLRCGQVNSLGNTDSVFFIEKGEFLSLALTPPAGTSTGNDKLQITVSGSIYKNDGRL